MKIKFALFIILILLQQPCFAQLKKKRADKEFQNYNFAIALDWYLKYTAKHQPDATTCFRIAECFRRINQIENACEWYEKAIKFQHYPVETHFYYGAALKASGEYMDAIDQFVTYGQKDPENYHLAKKFSSSAYQALEWKTYPEQIEIINYDKINSQQSDFSPTYYKGQLLFITDRFLQKENYETKELSGWTGTPFLKIVTERDNTITLFSKELTSFFHDGPVSFSPGGDTAFITRTFKVKNPKKLYKNREEASEFINRLEIWFAVKKENKWLDLQPFPYNNKLKYSVSHPTISNDGKFMIFASDMEGGFGGSDLYYSIIDPVKGFGKPVNLGKMINTPFRETFPYIAPDNSLYFSSDRPEGLGGLDIFRSAGVFEDWSQPENLKYPMNSSKDDFGILLNTDLQSGYLSSNRTGGYGSDDIYEFRKPGCTLAGITFEKSTEGNEIILEDVLIELYRKGDTTEVIGYARSAEEGNKKVCVRSYVPCQMVKNAKGRFYFSLQKDVVYELKASKEGYFTQTLDIPNDCKQPDDTINLAIFLNKIEINKPIVINDLFFDKDKMYVKKNIYFDLDKANIRHDASVTLDKLVRLLKDNPELVVELGAHTDSRHSTEYNNELSQKRAQSAVNYIISKGIDSSRITAKGYGETMLLNHCADGVACPEDLHQVNRRAEIKVIEVKDINVYKVKPNDTLFSISRRFNISVDQLKLINNLKDNRIFVGDELKIKRN